MLLKLEPDLAAQLLASRVAHQDEAMDQPSLLTRPPRPDATLIAVVLGVDHPGQHHRPSRHLAGPHLAATIQGFPVELLLVLFPGFTERRVGESDELLAVALDLQPVVGDVDPGGERAVDRPDVPGDRLRRSDQVAGAIEPIHGVTRPDPGLVADPAAGARGLDHLVMEDHAGIVLTAVPGFLRLAERVLFPLQAEGTILPAPLQGLLTTAVRAADMEPQVMRRLVGSLGYLALAGNARRAAADRLGICGTLEALVP
ncbi:hypothetical protein D9M69_510750 [compost metagenome]